MGHKPRQRWGCRDHATLFPAYRRGKRRRGVGLCACRSMPVEPVGLCACCGVLTLPAVVCGSVAVWPCLCSTAYRDNERSLLVIFEVTIHDEMGQRGVVYAYSRAEVAHIRKSARAEGCTVRVRQVQ